jgi:predicted Zn-dependent protease
MTMTDPIADMLTRIRNAARNKKLAKGAIFHSDRGSNYMSAEYAKVLEGLSLRRSAGRTRLDVVNAQVSYDQAKRAFEVGQLDRARRDIEAAINRFPDSVEYHLLHGRIHLEAHRLERSLAAFERVKDEVERMAPPDVLA